MTKNSPFNPGRLPIVLVLQGGGALGAYQGGVYQALHEHNLMPNWIVGTSIGAINAALIAGNEPAHRLRRVKGFWDRVAHPDQLDMGAISDAQRRSHIQLNTYDTVLRGAPGFFAPRWFSVFPLGLPVPPEAASFYDTGPLDATLRELVDFDYLNTRAATRLTINAVNVTSGELNHFDSRRVRIGPEHVRASGSLPPGFAPVRIDGELYWDGGLYSNTPLESVLAELPRGDTLCFMVDLWSAAGEEPATLEEVRTRQKDVTYASRTQRHIADYIKAQRLQRKLRELYGRLPADQRTEQDAREMGALGCDGTLHIVRLRYAGRDWHMESKDINFSKGSINWRWDQGYADAQRAVRHAGWLRQVAVGAAVVVHELPGHDAARRQAD
ncbi:MAG: patatin-like phospholipase family protein [Massilia sp.]